MFGIYFIRKSYFNYIIHSFIFTILRNQGVIWCHNEDTIRQCILSNCQYTYKQRLKGKTKCSSVRYYMCIWKFQVSQMIPIRHTLILDLDETLIYSCRYSDLSSMSSSLETIGITIVFSILTIILFYSYDKINMLVSMCINVHF